MKDKRRLFAVFLGVVLVSATFSTVVSGFEYDGGTGAGTGTDIVLVSLEGEDDLKTIGSTGGEVLEEYPDRALVEISERGKEELRAEGIDIPSTLPARTELNVKGHRFDIEEGMPEFSEDLTIDGYESGEEGLYLVHMMGPVHSEWRARLEARGIEIVNYVPNYAYEVRMTPEWAERVEDLDFVDWVDIYQPGFKLAEDVEPGLISVTFSSGERSIMRVEEEELLVELANRNDVYHISQFIEPELHDEMATQTIGGGLWIWDPEDDPDSAYRGDGDYGSLATQLGYDGDGIALVVADTGLDDGTTDEGHPDFGQRVIGGYDYESESYDEGEWDDGHGHGTHTAGSMAGHTHGGTEELVYEDYYAAEGTAPASELYGVKIFDDGGGWVGPEDDYHEIVEIPAQDEDHIYIHSNSWGASTDGEYTDSDEDFDHAVRDADRDTPDNDPMVITVAAGNDGPGAQGGGYNSVGSPGNAKNVITIGSTGNHPDSNPEAVSGFSSRGWTDDNRVKPDVMAPGEDIYSTEPESGYQYMQGTSMANPAVAGAASSLVDWYESNHGETPEPSMVKALMINTAYDLANEQADTGENSPYIPNQDEGWGMVNLPNVVHTDVNMLLENEDSLIETGQVQEYEIEQDVGDEPLRISLTWTDAPAAAGDDWTLENDLNLEVESPSGETYRGNNLVESWSEPGESTYDTFDTNDDGWDDVNNVENVYLLPEDVEDGTYTVRVIGDNVPSDANNDGDANQDYSLVQWNAVESETEPGPLPPSDPDPTDGATGVATDVEISADFEHEDGDQMDAYFYDDSDGSLIGEENNVASGDRASTMWEDLDYGTTYQWYAVAEDGEQTATSDTWSFTTEEAEPPTITITRPEGGEVWTEGDDEDITWDSTEGDGTITGVDLDYSTDGGDTWTDIVTGTEDDGSYTWTVPDEETDEAMIQATIHDDLGSSDTDTSGTFTIEGTTPPEITITRPEGGEEWNAEDDEDIEWDTTSGDGTITGVDLDYSMDGGDTWTNIVTGTEDDGSYTWTVPDEPTEEAQIRGTVHDDNDLSHQDESDLFTILGTPPAPPENLVVEHTGTGESQELVTNGTFPDDYEPWELTRETSQGETEARWHEENYDEGGSIYTMATQEGAAIESAIEEASWAQDIGPTSEEITVNGAYRMALDTEEHGHGESRTIAISSLLVYDTGLEDWEEIYYEELTQSGDANTDTDWIEFGPDATYTPEGDVNAVRAGMYVEATGADGPGGTQLSAEVETWMDNISVVAPGDGEGTEDNLIRWDASPEDPDDVTHYEVYRAEEEDGDYETIESLDADGSAEYEYIDEGKGTADDILWWYIVHAVDDQGQGCEGTEQVQEPGEEYTLTIEDITGEGTVYVDGDEVTSTPYDKVYNVGEEADLLAEPDPDWYFEDWEGIAEEDADILLEMDQDETVTAVFEQEVAYIEIEPVEETITAGGSQAYTATAYDQSDEEIGDVTDETEWSIDADAGGDWTDNEYTSEYSGNWTVTGGYENETGENLTDDADLHVEPGDPDHIVIDSAEQIEAEITITAGDNVTYNASSYDEFGNRIEDVTADAEWSIEDDAGGEWDQETGTYSSENAGTWTVNSTYTYDGEELVDETTLHVQAGDVSHIEIEPEEETITAGESLSYHATAYDDEGNEIGDVTDETTWSIDEDAEGEWDDNTYTSEFAGNWTVEGEYEGHTDDALLHVEVGEVDSVEIYPEADQTVAAGEELLFDAWAYDEQGNLIEDDPAEFIWENATNGVFDKEDTGEYDVTATYDDVTSSITTVTVEAGDADSLEIVEYPESITAGESFQVTVQATDEYGNPAAGQELNDFTINSEHDGEVYSQGTITLDENGNYTADIGEDQITTADDNHQITADAQDVENDSVSITVETTQVDHVVIIPDEDQTVAAGEELVFDAWANDTYDNVITDDVEDFDWENASNGVFHEEEAGEYDVTATYDDVTSSITTVTVEAGDADSLEIVDHPESITAGESFQMTVQATDEYGNPAAGQELEDFVINSEYDGEVYSQGTITLDENGNYTADIDEDQVTTADETHQITADAQDVENDSVSITVETAQVDHVVIIPEEDQTVAAGEELEFDAWANDTYDNVITDDVEDFDWENATNGLFSEEEAGEYDVTATYDDVTSPVTTVTVESEEGAVEGTVYDWEDDPVDHGTATLYETADLVDPIDTEDLADGTYLFENLTAEEEYWVEITDVEHHHDADGSQIIEADVTHTLDFYLELETPHELVYVTAPEDMTAGTEEMFTVQRLDEDGNEFTEGPLTVTLLSTSEGPYEFRAESGGDEVTEVVIADGESQVDFYYYDEDAGDHDITADADDVEPAVTTVTVEPAAVEYLVIEPQEESILAGDSLTYTATTYDEFDNEIEDVTEETEWSIEEDAGGTWDQENGTYTSENLGTWSVTGTYEEEVTVTDDATLHVEDADPEYIVIEPKDEVVTAGESQDYTAKAYDAVGNEYSVTEETEWSIEDGAGGNWAQDTGTYTAEYAGTWTVTGTYEVDGEELSDSALLEVTPAEVEDVELSPDEDQEVQAGEELVFTAEAYDGFDNLVTRDVVDFDWEHATRGVFSQRTTGDYEVTATYEDEEVQVTSVPTLVTVIPGDIYELEIDPERTTVSAGEEVDYTAVAYDRYGHEVGDVTEEATWSIDEDAKGEWDQTGTYTSEMAGKWSVTATYEVTGETILTVEPADEVDNVVIDPSEDRTVDAGEELLFSAEALDQYGNLITKNVADFGWENATNGVFYRRTAGDYEVTATYEGVTSPVTTVTVEAAEPDYIVIEPADETIGAGESLNYVATAYDRSHNEIGDVSDETTWADDIDDSGWIGSELTAYTAGDWTVTGEYEGLTDSVSLSVEPGAVDTVQLDPSEDQTIISGEKLDFSAEAYDEHGNLIAENVEAFEWENSIRGVFYYTEPGDYDVTATFASITSDPVTVTVEEDEEGTDRDGDGGGERIPLIQQDSMENKAEDAFVAVRIVRVVVDEKASSFNGARERKASIPR